MIQKENIVSRLLYRDALILVINKPCGIAVHKGTGGGENLEQSFHHLRFGLPKTPSLAHRLDRDTSGCLILGRHRQALIKLGKMFKKNSIKKTYWAMVHGKPEQEEGAIELPLSKQSQKSNKWQMEVDEEDGMQAITNYKIMASNNDISWLELYPQTGRTHQLRVHCSAMGFPIIGDAIYGQKDDTPMQLHARAIEIPLYPKKENIQVEAPAPEHIEKYLYDFGFKN